MSPGFANHSSVIALLVLILGNPPPYSQGCRPHTQTRQKAELFLALQAGGGTNKGLSAQGSVSAPLLQVMNSLKWLECGTEGSWASLTFLKQGGAWTRVVTSLWQVLEQHSRECFFPFQTLFHMRSIPCLSQRFSIFSFIFWYFSVLIPSPLTPSLTCVSFLIFSFVSFHLYSEII